jgi:hypothetical protein
MCGRLTRLNLAKVGPRRAIIIETVNMAFIVREKALLFLGQTLADLKSLPLLQRPVLSLAESSLWIIVMDVPVH